MKQKQGMMKKDPGVKRVEKAGWTKKEAGDQSGSGVYGTKRQNPQKQTWNLMEMRTETKQKKRRKRTDEGKGAEEVGGMFISFFPDLEDDKMFWYLHKLEKVLKLGQVVASAAFQTQKQFFCWASHCNTFRFRALYFFWTGQSELS